MVEPVVAGDEDEDVDEGEERAEGAAKVARADFKANAGKGMEEVCCRVRSFYGSVGNPGAKDISFGENVVAAPHLTCFWVFVSVYLV